MANKTKRDDSRVMGKGASGKPLVDGFCRACGASIPPRAGEGTCPRCAPIGPKQRAAEKRGALTPEQRRAVVERAFPPITRITGMPWAGVLIEEFVPTEGKRVYAPSPDDEEMGQLPD